MRSMITLTLLAVVLSLGAVAELQNVQLDGQITIRMNYLDLQNDVTKTYAEQRTLLGVQADFTDDVSAYIQFDNYSIWGEDFRSDDWESGVDERATIQGRNDLHAEVEVYQSYINVNDMWGSMVDLKIGRQELVFGSEWLMGNNDNGYRSEGLSWDAVRVDYVTDLFSVTAVAGKIDDRIMGDVIGDEDENLYMVYGSYLGMEDIVIDGYFIWLEDDADDEEVWTLGLRGAGAIGAIDFEAEVAFQDQNDGLGDDEFFAANLEIGYTLDVAWMPRLFLGGAYIEEDFNRLFSDVQYTLIRDDLHKNLEDIIVARGGVEVQPTENIAAGLEVSYIEEEDGGDERGIEVALDATYNYSEDLAFTLIYAHDFIDNGWGAGDDYDYVALISTISF